MIGENLCPSDISGQDVLFDVPNPIEGNALRVNRQRPDGIGHDAFRIPLLRPSGQHGIYNSQPFREFDADTYMVNFTVRFLGTRGEQVSHETGCDCVAADLPSFLRDGEPLYPALGTETCGESDMKLCDDSCTTAWGFLPQQTAECLTD